MARLFLVVVALGLVQCGLGNTIFDAEIEAGKELDFFLMFIQ